MSVAATAAWPQGSAAGLAIPAAERSLVARPEDNGRSSCSRQAAPLVTAVPLRPRDREERLRRGRASRNRAGGCEYVKNQ